MQVVAAHTAAVAAFDHDGRIAALLEDIAAARIRLDALLPEFNDERVRLRTNIQRSHEIWARITNEGYSRLFARPPAGGMVANLTAREVEVLRLIADGLSSKQIAYQLKIAFKTVVCHRSHILKKTNCHETASLVRLAIHGGLVA
jgi:DNA-binding NarL/FixJ family response regulator